jgi:hypothetical protein
MEQPHADVLRYEFPATEPIRGTRALRALSSRVIGPLQRDRRLLVYPLAVLMAMGIGVLGHVLGPSHGTSASRPAAVAPSLQTVEAGRDAPADRTSSAHPSDGDPAVPSPRTR